MKTLHLKSVCELLTFLFLLSFLSCTTGAKQDQASFPSPPPKKYQDIVSQAPKTPFENMLESTKGKDIEYMTDRFGFPTKSFKDPNENRVFEYDFSNIEKDRKLEKFFLKMFDILALDGIPFTQSLSSTQSDNYKCAFWLEVNDDDVIRKWRWEGKDCENIYQRIRQTIKSKLHGAWLGVEVQALTKRRFLNGVLINKVVPNSPAQKAGLIQGDVITKIDSQTVYKPQGLVDLISKRFPGETIQIEIYRDGKYGRGEVVLGEIPNPVPQQ